MTTKALAPQEPRGGVEVRDPASSYLARLAPGSRRVQAAALVRLVELVTKDHTPRTFPWHQVTYQHAQAMLVRLGGEGLKFTTQNRILSAFRGVLKEAWRLGMMTAEDHQRAADALKNVRGSSLPSGRMLGRDELRKLLASCRDDMKDPADPLKRRLGLRDAAVLVLLRFGLRRAEVVAALVEHFVSDEKGSTLRIVGKGNKEREVHLASDSARILRAWLKARPKKDDAGTIITSIYDARPVTAQAIYLSLKRRADALGLAGLSPHDFRRTFISELLDNGDVATAKELVGHANVNTTIRYDRRGDEVKRRAVKKIGW